MLWFPSVIKQAVYMTAPHPSLGKKWWVGAEDGQGRLITAWSQRPETPHILAQLKFNGRVASLTYKVEGKLGKGYIRHNPVATWVSNQKIWINTTQTTTGALMPYELSSEPTSLLREELIASVELAGRVSSPSEIVRLELCKGDDISSSAVRLDHYEHDHREVVDYPQWQTVYANASAAEEAINSVIQNRVKIGYAIEKKDMSRIFSASLHQATPLVYPDAQALIWDF